MLRLLSIRLLLFFTDLLSFIPVNLPQKVFLPTVNLRTHNKIPFYRCKKSVNAVKIVICGNYM
jgi:hypothetical protein